ncbi:MAG: hypothetical protein AAFW46_03140 [Pseudomonadota bacterium]
MPLILEVLSVWVVAAGAGLAYQRYRARPWGEAAHLAAIFGIFIALVYFIVLIAIDFSA